MPPPPAGPRHPQDGEAPRRRADDLLRPGRCVLRCRVAAQVGDPRVLRRASERISADRKDLSVIDQIADRGQEQRPSARARARLHDPLRPQAADQLLVREQIGWRPVCRSAEPCRPVPLAAAPERFDEFRFEVLRDRRGPERPVGRQLHVCVSETLKAAHPPWADAARGGRQPPHIARLLQRHVEPPSPHLRVLVFV